jgi:methylase of polypeptide subunit release factors
MSLAGIDLAILAIYAVFIFGLAQWVSRSKSGEQKTSTDYFMASKSLPWWAIGASLIAANISAEQIIGIDISDTALDVAQENFRMLSPNVVAAHGDGAAFIKAMKQPFFVISNPPYIPEGTALQKDVADFEPHEALFAGESGADQLVRLARAAAHNGACLGIMLELRNDQCAVVKKMLGAM